MPKTRGAEQIQTATFLITVQYLQTTRALSCSTFTGEIKFLSSFFKPSPQPAHGLCFIFAPTATSQPARPKRLCRAAGFLKSVTCVRHSANRVRVFWSTYGFVELNCQLAMLVRRRGVVIILKKKTQILLQQQRTSFSFLFLPAC